MRRYSNKKRKSHFRVPDICGIYLICFILGTLWLSPNSVYGIESLFIDKNLNIATKKVVILPFDIHAKEDISYLKNKIPEVIGQHLEKEGAVIVKPAVSESELKKLRQSIKGIQDVAVKSGADYAVWGSLTRIGQKFSLDAKMTASKGKDAPVAFFVEGESIENLSAIVKEVASNFSIKIFKREKVLQVRVTGNKRIEADAIKGVIKTKPGNVYLAKSLSEDLKAIYAMGYFDDIRIEAEDNPGGRIITFRVKEKATIRNIVLKGNKVYEEKEIKDALNIKGGSVLNIFAVKENLKRIESLYKEKNYHGVQVSYNIKDLNNNQTDLEFIIEEGEKIKIKSITLVGNKEYPDKKLKGIMKTTEKGFWSWLTSSGEFNKENLNQDIAKVSAFYHNNGFIETRIGEPEVEYKGEWIYITLKIDEGTQFKVGKVEVKGDLIRSEDELKKDLKIADEIFCNGEVLRKDVLALNDIYADEGYAFAEIAPRLDKDPVNKIANIAYTIKKNKQVYIERIIIAGNTKTRDKIIRRELKIREQELYNNSDLKRSIRNLHRLDYFEDVNVDRTEGSSDEKVVLKIDVKEKATGTFSFGGGYSSVEKAFVMASVTQQNLFGRGQILQLKGEVGGTSDRYTLSFTEPWLFDIPLSAGFDLYNWRRDYDTYDKDSKGGGIRFGYPVFDYTRLYLSYSYDIADIENVTDEASNSVIEMEGRNVMSSVATTLSYDSRDKVFNPTEGGDHSLTFQYAGIGGDIAFTKYSGELGQYIPLFWETVGFVHAKGGYVREGSDGKLPDYERFYLGGMNSLRGFDWRDICSLDENGDEIGGDKFVQFNLEFLVPLIKKAGLVGVLFYDTGNVFNNGEEIEFESLRKSAGFGFRWYSPMGPIRIENGYILDPEEGESSSGKWEFTMGGSF